MQYIRPRSTYCYFSSKNMAPDLPRFHVINTKKATAKTSTLWHFCKDFTYYIICAITLERFHVVTDSCTALFSGKTCFYETNIFYVKNWKDLRKNIICFRKCMQSKGNVSIETFQNFAYVSSYLQTKTFARKRECAKPSKLQRPRY